MTLPELKWLALLVIFSLTLLTGFLSIRFTSRFRKHLEVADAIANGIFIGAALFHLLPEAIMSFRELNSHFAYAFTTLLLAISYIVFWFLERFFFREKEVSGRQVHIGVLVTILSIHAFVAGLTLGISQMFSLVSILFIAIIAHKGFETFAFVINLNRQIESRWQLKVLVSLFSLITPMGIFIGMLSGFALHSHWDTLLCAYFSAIAAGTFLYIGTGHSHPLNHHDRDSHRPYARLITTIGGVVAMGVVGIWI